MVGLQHGKPWGWEWPTSLRRQPASKGCSLCHLGPRLHLSSPSSRVVGEVILSSCCSVPKKKKWTRWRVRLHAHGGLVSSSQNNDADFQVTPSSRAGVIGIAQEEPFPHHGVTWERKRRKRLNYNRSKIVRDQNEAFDEEILTWFVIDVANIQLTKAGWL